MWPSVKYIALTGSPSRVAVYDTGDAGKPVLFFVHGLGVNGQVWKDAIARLQGTHRCIAIDLPGHGNSWNERGNFSMSFYAQVLRACIEAMQLPELTLIGHSMGGQISIIAALQLPAIVQRLVLVAAAGIETFTPDEAMKVAQGAEFIYKAPLDLPQLLALYQPKFGLDSERVKELAHEHITQQAERFALFSETVVCSIKGMLYEPVQHFLPHIHQPVLVLYGEGDGLIPNRWIHPALTIADVAATAKQKLRHSEVKVLPMCGHYLQFEQPKVFAEAVEGFVRN